MAETTLFVSGGLKTDPPVVYNLRRTALKQNRVVVASDEQEDVQPIVGVGRTWLEQKIVIVDPNTLTLCPTNQVGEIWVSGANVASGYWNRPEETKRTFNAYLAETNVSSVSGIEEGPFLRTGDLGFLQNGELFVTGRIKDVIIVRGRNHYPQDIELTVEKSHPALRAGCAAAFTVEVQSGEQLVIACEVERTYLRQLNVDEIVRAIRQAVSEHHELQVYAVVLLKTASIPKTSSGKIQRHACRLGFFEGSLDVVGDWTANPQIDLLQIQAEVEALWEHVQHSTQPLKDEKEFESQERSPVPSSNLNSVQSALNLSDRISSASQVESSVGFALQSQSLAPTKEIIRTWLVTHLALYLKVLPNNIDVKQPFAAYGLDSSVAVSITGELAQWLGCELEPTLFWEYPSIEALAQHLEAECQLSHQASKVIV